MIKHRTFRSRFLLLFLSLAFTLQGQGEWELKQDKDNIKIYTRENELSDFDEFRATTQLDQSIHAFIAVLKDIPAIPDWMYSVESSRLLETSGDTLQIYYTEASVPFPLKNRDGIYMNRFRWNLQNRTLTVDIELLPDYLEQKGNMVRISQGRGFWEAKENSGGILDLIFQMQVDPGGSIPSWLANMFAVDTPYNTLIELKRLAASQKYQEVRYGFVKEE